MERVYYVGLDVHKDSISVAMLHPEQGWVEWQCGGDPTAVDRLARRLAALEGTVRSCYEAGPCGYDVLRRLAAKGVSCLVVAPSLIPVKPGQRVKTDRRDARKLAELLRADMLTPVRPPTPQQESARDLCRCREDAVQDLTRARHRLSKWLLRRGLDHQGRHWTLKHRAWLRGLRFDDPADEAVCADYLLAVELLEQRLRTLTERLEAVAHSEPYKAPVAWLRCFRGIELITAMGLVTELHGFERFTDPHQLMSYLGLTPSEDSSGSRQRRGAITRAGNGHVRRLLIEAAWQYRHPARTSAALRSRRAGQPGAVIALAERCQLRLCGRYRHLTGRGKDKNVVAVALARELVGFIWAALRPGAFGPDEEAA